MAILLIAEHDQRALKAATRQALAAARRMGEDIDVLVAGTDCAGVAAQAARLAGIARVQVAEAPHYADHGAENLAALVAARGLAYTHIVAAASAFGKNILPRVAALLDVAQISDIVAVESADTFVRPIYAGNVLATVASEDAIKVVSVRATAFEAAPEADSRVPIEAIAPLPDLGLSRVVGRALTESERPELTAAQVIVTGGRGLGSADNYRGLLEPLADKLNAALGASRAAVDAGYAPNDAQVGQTGKIVAPRLYVAVGVSGAIQHLAGMKDSKVIVAINKDPEAPIFQVADYGLVADLFQALPEMAANL